MSKALTLKPRISEKTYAQSEALNVYVFEVEPGVSKQLIGQAVAAQYKVGVTAVRVASLPSKTRRTYQRGGRSVNRGVRSGIRKAYVTLKAGDKLPIFAAVEDSPEPKETKKGKK
jgi:ribosomal protein L23